MLIIHIYIIIFVLIYIPKFLISVQITNNNLTKRVFDLLFIRNSVFSLSNKGMFMTYILSCWLYFSSTLKIIISKKLKKKFETLLVAIIVVYCFGILYRINL